MNYYSQDPTQVCWFESNIHILFTTPRCPRSMKSSIVKNISKKHGSQGREGRVWKLYKMKILNCDLTDIFKNVANELL